jgi:hypothetical protein
MRPTMECWRRSRDNFWEYCEEDGYNLDDVYTQFEEEFVLEYLPSILSISVPTTPIRTEAETPKVNIRVINAQKIIKESFFWRTYFFLQWGSLVSAKVPLTSYQSWNKCIVRSWFHYFILAYHRRIKQWCDFQFKCGKNLHQNL